MAENDWVEGNRNKKRTALYKNPGELVSNMVKKKTKVKSVSRKAPLGKPSAAQQLWEKVVENLPESIIVVDMEGKVMQCNRGSEEMFGYAREEMKGMHVRNFHPPSNWDKVLPVLFKEALQNGKWEDVIPLVRKGNQEFQAHLTVIKLEENGKPIGLIGITRDLSPKTSPM